MRVRASRVGRQASPRLHQPLTGGVSDLRVTERGIGARQGSLHKLAGWDVATGNPTMEAARSELGG